MIITILVTNQQNAQAASFEVSDENVFDRCNGATGKIATILKSEQDSDGKNLRIKIPDSHPHQDNARVLTVSGEQMLGIFQAMGMFQFKEQRQELLMQPAITLEGLAEIHALIRQTIDIENPKDAAWVMDRVIFFADFMLEKGYLPDRDDMAVYFDNDIVKRYPDLIKKIADLLHESIIAADKPQAPTKNESILSYHPTSHDQVNILAQLVIEIVTTIRKANPEFNKLDKSAELAALLDGFLKQEITDEERLFDCTDPNDHELRSGIARILSLIKQHHEMNQPSPADKPFLALTKKEVGGLISLSKDKMSDVINWLGRVCSIDPDSASERAIDNKKHFRERGEGIIKSISGELGLNEHLVDLMRAAMDKHLVLPDDES